MEEFEHGGSVKTNKNILGGGLLLKFGLFLILSTTIFSFSVATPLHAQVTVNNVIVTFLPTKRPIQNVLVGNSSENPAYVLAHVEVILNPGEQGDKVEPSKDILVSPKTFSIEPYGERAVRMLLRKVPTEKEKVYRVLFTPQDRGFGQEVKETVSGRTASIRVLTGMGVLVFVQPKNPLGHLKWKRTKNKITFTNVGNVHVELGEGKMCVNEDCKEAPRKRVYAGQTYEIPVKADRKIEYLMRTGSLAGFEAVELPALEGESIDGEFIPGKRVAD